MGLIVSDTMHLAAYSHADLLRLVNELVAASEHPNGSPAVEAVLVAHAIVRPVRAGDRIYFGRVVGNDGDSTES